MKQKNKNKNKKNKDWSWNINNKEGQAVIFKGWERKEEKKEWSISNKSPHQHWHVLQQ